MARDEQGHAKLGLKRLENFPHFSNSYRVESVDRLIQQKQLWLHAKREHTDLLSACILKSHKLKRLLNGVLCASKSHVVTMKLKVPPALKWPYNVGYSIMLPSCKSHHALSRLTPFDNKK